MERSWSECDRLWIELVLELPGCFADGETPAEAIANAPEVIGLWIETARTPGMAIPQLQQTEISSSA